MNLNTDTIKFIARSPAINDSDEEEEEVEWTDSVSKIGDQEENVPADKNQSNAGLEGASVEFNEMAGNKIGDTDENVPSDKNHSSDCSEHASDDINESLEQPKSPKKQKPRKKKQRHISITPVLL